MPDVLDDDVELELPDEEPDLEDEIEDDGQEDQGDEEGEDEEVDLLDVTEFADRRVRIKVDGEEVTVPLSEALAGYSRQADYTRKTQELAQQRAELQWATAIRGALENDPAGTLELLKAHFGVSDAKPASSPWDDDPQFDEDDPFGGGPVDPKIAEIEARLRRFEEVEAQQRLQSEISRLQNLYGDDFDPREVVAAAMAAGTADLEGTYKQIAFDRVVAKRREAEQRAAKAEGRTAKKRQASVVTGGTSSARSGTNPDVGSINSIEDAWREAKRLLGQT